jgi:hypothetical protein
MVTWAISRQIAVTPDLNFDRYTANIFPIVLCLKYVK